MNVLRRMLLGVAMLLCGGLSAGAQLNLSVRMQHARVLLYEPLRCEIELENLGGTPVLLEEEEIGFRIERAPGRLLAPSEDPPFVGGIVVPANQKSRQSVNLLNHFEVDSTGPYTLQVWVEVNGERLISRPVFFDVVPGLEIAKQVFAHPETGNRQLFRLFVLSRDRHERLLLRIDDIQEKLCFGVMDLGDVIRLDPPVMLGDQKGRVNILHLTQPGLYFHSVVAFSGQPISQDAYFAQTAQISMVADPATGVAIQGGTPVEETQAGDMPIRRIPPRK